MIFFKKKREKEKITKLEGVVYTKVALDNINHSANKITVREMEAQIQCLKDLYTLEKLIERAKKL